MGVAVLSAFTRHRCLSPVWQTALLSLSFTQAWDAKGNVSGKKWQSLGTERLAAENLSL